jgi:quercetin dioxygenase-like cupin family protein
MRIFRDTDTPSRPVDASSFVGPAATKLLASAEEGAAVNVYRVAFDPGGRTNWHTHSGPQWLFVTEGQIRFQCWGQPPGQVGPGDAVLFFPGEKHWHGAPPDGHGVHLAVNISVKTEWFEPVAEEMYRAALTREG